MPKGKRIVIVEDEVLVLMKMQEDLEAVGCLVVGTAGSAEEGRDLILGLKPDLAIVDIFLSGPMNGIELVSHINGIQGTPFIYVTGNTDRGTYEKARHTRHLGYYEKPLNSMELQRAVRETLDLLRFGGHGTASHGA